MAGGGAAPSIALEEQRKQHTAAAGSMADALARSWRRIRPPKTAVPVNFEFALLSGVVYGVLYFSMGSVWLPGSPAFALLVIWICAVVAAEVVHWLRIPRVVGMLASGLLLANVPGHVVSAFPPKWGTQLRAAALATIFLRCGLELEFKTMRLYKWPALRLAFIPGLVEALFDGGLAVILFGMPVALGFSLGFILKAVGPGLVVPAMFQMQKQGLGADKGIPSTVVISASFDDIIAITGFSICVNIAFGMGAGSAWQIAQGPVQVIFGIVGGIFAGAILGCTRIFNHPAKRFIGAYGAALLVMFFLEYFGMLSGGALGSLAVGLAACYFWESGQPRWASLGPSTQLSAGIERVTAKVWNWVMEPILFGTIGVSIVFSKLGGTFIPYALIIICSGLVLRMGATFITMSGLNYNAKERIFYAIAWTPKATVQAALSAVPLAMVNSLKSPSSPDYADWVYWGEAILTTGIFTIIVCASLGTLLTYWLAPLLLNKQDPPSVRIERKTSGRMSNAITSTSGASLSSPRSAPQAGLAAGPLGAAAVSGSAAPRAATPMGDAAGAGAASGAPGATTAPTGASNVVEEYFDAVEDLVSVVRKSADDGSGAGGVRDDADAVCARVEELQQRLNRELGARELTVRQMLASAASRHDSLPWEQGQQLSGQLGVLSVLVEEGRSARSTTGDAAPAALLLGTGGDWRGSDGGAAGAYGTGAGGGAPAGARH